MSQVVATSLFEKLGGKPAIEAVVEEFYIRVLADADLKGFFAGTDMDNQAKQQVNFLTMALGGPNDYEGRPMKEAHEDLGITEHHFNLVAGHLVATLKWAGVCESDINEVVAAVAPLKEAIVTA